ncbi:AAA family ATPase [Methylomonas sp. MED-D]|uniref:AAA family ATPase n=1 Tax=Methylomonas sp. MED-D TaxID=3418768 RepID=UPI003D018CFD
MRLLSIQLFNFRQFYLKTPEIIFSDGFSNITVIHANNGSGKTALLNAFTWALFDTTTSGFQLPEQIVNKRAIREAKIGDIISAWVEIKFEHEDKKFYLKRETQVRRTDGDPCWIECGLSSPTLQWSGPDGKLRTEDDVYNAIYRILPKDLHSYFFFDGERIERIVQPTTEQRNEIKKAAKKLLGIEIIERAAQHLVAARKELEQEFKRVADTETEKKLGEKEVIESEIQKYERRNEEIENELSAYKEHVDEIDKRLSQHAEARELQENRERLIKEIGIKKSNYLDTGKALSDFVSKKGFLVFLKEPVNIFNEQLNLLRQKGELPSGIKKQFVQDLLDHQKCICGTALLDGMPERNAVERWRSQAGMVDVEEKALRIGGELKNFEDQYDDFLVRIRELKDDRNKYREEISRNERQLDEIKDELKKSPREEISSLEYRRAEIENSMETLRRESIGNDRLIQDRNSLIEKLNSEIEKYRTNEKKQQVAQLRVKAASDAYNRMNEMLHLFDLDFRKDLNSHIKNFFSKISLTPYIPNVADDYSISLFESAGGAPLLVAASQGESQILSLAFIGSIIEIVRRKLKEKHLPGPDASSYPLVMDSPFGSLDQNYRRQIAKYIPELANQVVVLVTKTQWRGEVEDEMTPKIGKSYVLTYYTPKAEVIKDDVSIDGHSYPLVMQSPNEFEYTEVLEINNG